MYWIFKNNFYKAFEKYYDFLTYNMSDMTQWVKNLPANAGDIRDVAFIPGLGRSPGEGKGYPLQYSVHEVAKSQTRLSDFNSSLLNI